MSNLDQRTECSDGTVCENSTPCVAHPTKEGKYMCDCLSAFGGAYNDIVKYAGVYCEHPVTTYCQKGGIESAHSFCANGGECERMVGAKEEHGGCKCPVGYAGRHCQFVEGSVPSDWSLDNFIHPMLLSHATRGNEQPNDLANGAIVGIVFGASIFLILSMYFVGNKVKGRSDKEMDTATFKGSSTPSDTPAEASGSSEFIGGKSVYKRKNSAGPRGFVTPDSIEADGGVLKEAMGEGQQQDGDAGLGEGGTSMEEVSLDELPSSLNETKGELA